MHVWLFQSISDIEGGTHTEMGGYPYQNTIKHSTVKTKINLISALNDRQNESTRKTQQQNKKHQKGNGLETAEKHKNVWDCKPVLVCFGLGSLSGKTQ